METLLSCRAGHIRCSQLGLSSQGVWNRAARVAAPRQGRGWDAASASRRSQLRCCTYTKKIDDAPTKSERERSGRESRLEYDVVIVGAGIIGIATAHHILINTKLSVALVDAAEPCAGATGAGQGYIWMSHRTPGSPGWDLATRSKLLWEELATEIQSVGVNPLEAMGWRNTGSLLVASNNDDAQALRKRVEALSAGGVAAEYLTSVEAEKKEPALAAQSVGGAAFLPGDSQIDARLTVALLQERIRAFSAAGRYQEFFQSPVLRLIRSPTEARIQGVETIRAKMFGTRAVVIATGAWSSILMKESAAEWGLSLVPPIKPRKGHLLVLKGDNGIQLRHGIMEFEYLGHQSTEEPETPEVPAPPAELAMTATLDHHGNLLLGSSREFVGFNVDVQDEVVESIRKRAEKYLPGLSRVSSQQILQQGTVRTGLRPFITDGRPLIGPVVDIPGLIFATGHEGSGLCLSLATAEMVTNIIQEVDCHVDPRPFSPLGRLGSPN